MWITVYVIDRCTSTAAADLDSRDGQETGEREAQLDNEQKNIGPGLDWMRKSVGLRQSTPSSCRLAAKLLALSYFIFIAYWYRIGQLQL